MLKRMLGRFAFLLLILDVSAARAADPTFEDLQKLLNETKPTTIAEVMVQLKQRYPVYLKRHALAYESMSLQDASYQNPRAIVFGDTASLVMTFNGDPSQAGYGTLEVMSFSLEKGYQFRDISFTAEPHGHGGLIAPDEIETRTSQYVISKPNPKACLACHGTETPRPIWQAYSTWPGMYGSTDDFLFQYLYDGDGNPVPDPSSGGHPTTSGPLKIGAEDTEKKGFEIYLALKDKNPRYRNLPFPQGPDGIPYAYGPGTGYYFRRPNLALTKLFSLQNSQRLLQKMTQGQGALKNLAIAGIAQCLAVIPTQEIGNRPKLKWLVESAARWRKVFANDISQVMDEDYKRMQRNFKGGLISLDPYQAGDTYAGYMVYSYTLAAAVEKMGVKLTDYAVNVRRLNEYDDGGSGFYALRKMVKDDLKAKLKLDRDPTCEELYELL